jgi:hypothetical protein
MRTSDCAAAAHVSPAGQPGGEPGSESHTPVPGLVAHAGAGRGIRRCRAQSEAEFLAGQKRARGECIAPIALLMSRAIMSRAIGNSILVATDLKLGVKAGWRRCLCTATAGGHVSSLSTRVELGHLAHTARWIRSSSSSLQFHD